MSGDNRYLLDSNVFIQASQSYYDFDTCPGFWRALVIQHEGKRVFSIDRVQSELTDGNDALSDWAKETVPEGFFKQTNDQAVIDTFGEMVTWADVNAQFSASAKAEFAEVADGWLVAYAKVNGLIVVTQEGYRPDAKRTIPIPNVCREFGVNWVDTFEMLSELKVQFSLKTKRR